MSKKIMNLRSEMIYKTGLLTYSSGGNVSYQSAANYKVTITYFADYCRAQGIKHLGDLKGRETAVLQAYADALAASGKSASTVHTYLAPACKALGVGMGAISKPIRYGADFVKSAPSTLPAPDQMTSVQQLAAAIGIRKAELGRLRGEDLGRRANGEMYVIVQSGKGGKRQEQRILPINEAVVAAAFDGVSPHQYVLDKGVAENTAATHALRRQAAQTAYKYFVTKGSTPEGRREIYDTVAARWHSGNHAGHRKELEAKSYFDRAYVVRGKNRAAALAAGAPVSYDRLAVRAASIEALAHWRDNVTIGSYLLPR